MAKINQIEKEKQIIIRCERSLALEKLKKRRADTRLKIEFGGLVIKSGFDLFDKQIILGALSYARELIEQDSSYIELYKSIGVSRFLVKKSV